MKLMIRVIRGRDEGKSFELARLPAVIGRGSDCNIRLNDDSEKPTISRHHATLAFLEDQLLLIDHSTNGTEVNNRWLENGESVLIDSSEVVRVGQDTWLGILLAEKEGRATVVFERERKTSPATRPTPSPTPVSLSKGEIFEKLCDRRTLEEAWKRASLNRGGPGVDGVTVDDFSANSDLSLRQLENELRSRRYQPMPLRVFSVPKGGGGGGTRRISIPTVRDRIVNHALLSILTPLFEPTFAHCSFAYRPGRSAHDATRKVSSHIKSGLKWVLDADIASFFDTVNHVHLIKSLAEVIKDEDVMEIIKRWLTVACTGPGIGIPQGAATSPLFANAYLNGFDRHMLEAGYNIVRYADDFVCIESSQAQAQNALMKAERYLRELLALQLKPEKTRIVSIDTGFTFLGFRFDSSGVGPSQDAYESLAKKLSEFPEQEERREKIIRGWEQYFGPVERSEETPVPPSPYPPSPTSQKAPPLQGEGREIGEGWGEGEESQGDGENDRGEGETFDIEERFIALFVGRTDVHARQWINKNGKVGYSPVGKPITAEDVRLHFAGDVTLATYIHRSDNTVRFAVIDVDEKKGTDRDNAMKVSFGIRQVAHKFGIKVYVEDSGHKGYHCWIFFSEPVQAGIARKLGMLLVSYVQPLPEGVTTEVFPRQEKLVSDALGPIMKLPFGIHKSSGRRCVFLDQEGEPMELPELLQGVKTLKGDAVEKALLRLKGGRFPLGNTDCSGTQIEEHRCEADVTKQDVKARREGGTPKASFEVDAVLSGCGMLRRLCQKPAATGHLTHTERLILLYTLGRLGENGHSFLHKVIGLCDNYNPRITQQWLDRLETDRPPIGCAKIRDWMSEIEPDWKCDCSEMPEVDGYKTPIAFAVKRLHSPSSSPLSSSSKNEEDEEDEGNEGEEKPKKRARRSRAEVGKIQTIDADEEEIWKDVSEDLFSDGEEE